MTKLKSLIPAWLEQWYRNSDGYVRYRSRNQNHYHCTVQKSASQWLRGILSDPRTYRHCGLRPYRYQDHLPGRHDPRKLTLRRFDQAFPPATIATPVYIDYEGFATIPKPPHYKAFFVMRDPRDVLISWYFSSKFSHPLLGEMDRIRQDLNRLSQTEGLLYCIRFLDDFGLFAAQRSWAGASAKDSRVMLVRFEDLIASDPLPIVERLLAHCDIAMPREVLDELWRSYRFEELSGRQRGQEDPGAHYRKGIQGDWRNYFNDEIHAYFTSVAGDVVRMWNYS